MQAHMLAGRVSAGGACDSRHMVREQLCISATARGKEPATTLICSSILSDAAKGMLQQNSALATRQHHSEPPTAGFAAPASG
jgi:hypothetical protein